MPRRSNRAMWTAKLTGQPMPRGGNVLAAPAPTLGTRWSGLVVGVDPSLRGTGLAVVAFERGEPQKLLHSETLKLAPKFSMAQCLGVISEGVTRVLALAPEAPVAFEATIYVQNFQTAQILGAARGAAMAAAVVARREVFEYPPLRVKQAVAGFGRASKEQVGRQVMALLKLPKLQAADESDAAAVAICHALTWRGEGSAEG